MTTTAQVRARECSALSECRAAERLREDREILQVLPLVREHPPARRIGYESEGERIKRALRVLGGRRSDQGCSSNDIKIQHDDFFL